MRDGEVAEPLVPILKVRAEQVEAMIEDLGGVREVTAMQRAVLDGWLKAAVAADIEFSRLVGQEGGNPERLATYLNSCRANLVSLGLHRRARSVEGITEYLARQGDNSDDD